MELEMLRWLEENLQGKADPVKIVVSKGVPALTWVENAYKLIKKLDIWEEWLKKRHKDIV